MKALSQTRRITIAASIFAVIILIGLFFVTKPDNEYVLTADQTLATALETTDVINCQMAAEIVSKKDKSYQFIDLRNHADFNIKHLEESINVPKHELLSEGALELFEDKGTNFVLYAESHSEANGPWMILRQLGIENVRVLACSFEDLIQGNQGIRNSEETAHDFNQLLKDSEQRIIEEKKAAEVVVVKKASPRVQSKPKPAEKKKTVKLLPKKVEEEEEEEEGC